jgi:hypothetical protein
LTSHVKMESVTNVSSYLPPSSGVHVLSDVAARCLCAQSTLSEHSVLSQTGAVERVSETADTNRMRQSGTLPRGWGDSSYPNAAAREFAYKLNVFSRLRLFSLSALHYSGQRNNFA